ncbi:acyltransferase [Fredinandcohnia quinoae]|uniref:Acyltransferase n=1 Tax=Fredinandcohnia quinoae TaxID=2918902 RepID=A0AAW5EB53_9BACI|nr:acyltransferase [Fredinandcohnia sp. SECRCQ15]MCH1626004.1 acyltransferase [Fredinandcohnia sp. SECRCQ15]
MTIDTRDHSIDYFKGLLVIGMVYTHVLQFFSDVSIFPSIEYSINFFNLITFSGFVFCFGYVCQLAYYRKTFQLIYKKMLLTGLKTLLAFYLSGIAFQVYVGQQALNMNTIVPILLLDVIPGWSEFLVSFSIIILLGLVFFPILIWISNRPIVFWIICLLLLGTTWIDYSKVTIPQLGLLVGTTQFPTFPVVQYFPFYLIGMYFARHRIGFKWRYFLTSVVGSILFLSYLIFNEMQLPGRFPPSIYWIIGPTFVLYVAYLFTRTLDKWKAGSSFLRIMGENVLAYLLLSNIIIFSLDRSLTLFIVGPWKGLFGSILLLLIITFLITLVNRSSRPRGRSISFAQASTSYSVGVLSSAKKEEESIK